MSARGLFVGRSTLDIVHVCDRAPGPDDKIDARSGYTRAGGPALNAAVAFAGLGGEARLLSVIGAGPLADWASRDIAGHGVEVFDAAAGEPGVLPVSSIILTGPSRAVVAQSPPPAGMAAREQAVERILGAGADVVLSDGHLPELALPALRWARGAGVPTVLDGGSWKPWTEQLLPFVDIAILSARFQPPGGADPIEHLSRTIAAVAVTNGPGAIRWRQGAASGEVQPPAVEAIDTLGAGDVFHGAFCWSFAAGGDFLASLAAAAEIASRSCTRWGARI